MIVDVEPAEGVEVAALIRAMIRTARRLGCTMRSMWNKEALVVHHDDTYQGVQRRMTRAAQAKLEKVKK